jgi:hypothetical protein
MPTSNATGGHSATNTGCQPDAGAGIRSQRQRPQHRTHRISTTLKRKRPLMPIRHISSHPSNKQRAHTPQQQVHTRLSKTGLVRFATLHD